MLEKEERILSLVESLQKENPEGVKLRDLYRKAPRDIGRNKNAVKPIIEKLHQQGKITPLKIGKKQVWKICDQETYFEQPDFISLAKWMSWKCKFVKEITRFADEATLHIFCHDSEWFNQWIDDLQDTLRAVPGRDETIGNPSPMDADHPLWKEA